MVYEGYLEGNIRISHPERQVLWTVENEKHTLVLGEIFSLHKANSTTQMIICDLGSQPGHIFMPLAMYTRGPPRSQPFLQAFLPE